MSTADTRRWAISWYLPDDKLAAPWPRAGPVAREQLCAGGSEAPIVWPLLARSFIDSLFLAEPDWVILEIAPEDYVERGEAFRRVVDFVRGTVLFNGPCRKAAAWLNSQDLPVPQSYTIAAAADWEDLDATGATVVVAGCGGHTRVGTHAGVHALRGTVTADDHSIATVRGGNAHAGDGGLAGALEFGDATAGFGGIATCGDAGNASSGDRGVSIAVGGIATSGDRGVAIAHEECGSASTGEKGISVGFEGAAVGANGIAVATDPSCVLQGGVGALLIAMVYTEDDDRLPPIRIAAIVGADGIKPDIPHVIDRESRRFVETARRPN